MSRWIKVFCSGLVLSFMTVLLLPGAASAKLEVGAGLCLGWPRGDFSDEVDFAWGGGVRAGWGFNEQAAGGASLFLDLSYLNYGRERQTVPFNIYTQRVLVDVVTDNYMVLFSPGLQVGLRRGWLRPYGEFFGGFTYIATRSKVEDRGINGQVIASSTNFSDWTYNLGGGGGIQVPLWQRKDPSKVRELVELSEAMLDIKFSYIKGGEATYLKEGSIIEDEAGIQYNYSQSKTDMFLVRIGVSFRF